LSRFSAFFSFIVLAGFFFCSFFWSMPFMVALPWCGGWWRSVRAVCARRLPETAALGPPRRRGL